MTTDYVVSIRPRSRSRSPPRRRRRSEDEATPSCWSRWFGRCAKREPSPPRRYPVLHVRPRPRSDEDECDETQQGASCWSRWFKCCARQKHRLHKRYRRSRSPRCRVQSDEEEEEEKRCWPCGLRCWKGFLRGCAAWCWRPCVDACPRRQYVTVVRPGPATGVPMDHTGGSDSRYVVYSVQHVPKTISYEPDPASIECSVDLTVRLFEHLSRGDWGKVTFLVCNHPEAARASLNGTTAMEKLILSAMDSLDTSILHLVRLLLHHGARVDNTHGTRSILAMPGVARFLEFTTLFLNHGADPAYEEGKLGNVLHRVLPNTPFDHLNGPWMTLLFQHTHTPKLWSDQNGCVERQLNRMLAEAKARQRAVEDYAPGIDAYTASHDREVARRHTESISQIQSISEVHHVRCILLEAECRRCIGHIFSSSAVQIPPGPSSGRVIASGNEEKWCTHRMDVAGSLGKIVLDYLNF